MFDREIDYYGIAANTDCITATERIIDKSIALAPRVKKAEQYVEAAKSEHEIFLLALECCNQFCQGSGSVEIPTGHKLFKRSSYLHLQEKKLFSDFLDHYFDLILVNLQADGFYNTNTRIVVKKK